MTRKRIILGQPLARSVLLVSLLTLPFGGPCEAMAGTRAAPMRDRDFALSVSEAARRFALAESYIWAVMRTESAGNPRAISPAGAMGLMQLMPATWASLTTRYQLGTDPFDSHANILAGAAYLRAMLDRYGDVAGMLAAYNAGPRRVDKWRAGLGPLPAETIAYVRRIAPDVQQSGALRSHASVPPAPDWRGAGMFITSMSDSLKASTFPQITQAPRSLGAGTNDPPALPQQGRPPLFVARTGQGRP